MRDRDPRAVGRGGPGAVARVAGRGRSRRTGWRFTSVEARGRRGRSRRRTAGVTSEVYWYRNVAVSYSRLSPTHAVYTGSGIGDHVVVDDVAAGPRCSTGAARGRRRARTPRGSRRTRRRRRAGCRRGGGTSSVQCSRPGVATGVADQREVLGAAGVGEDEEPVAPRADVVLDVVLVAVRARRRRSRRCASGVGRGDAATPRW